MVQFVYDKLHNIAITSSYNLNEKWSFGANFVLQTGQPVTHPVGNMNTRNEFLVTDCETKIALLPPLRSAATLTPTKNKNRDWKGEWVLVFTMCTIENAASISFRQNNDTGSNEAVKTPFWCGSCRSYNLNFKPLS
jgi:long-subunit fatty acid transport protein